MHHSFDVSEPSGAQQGRAIQTHSQGKQEPDMVRLTSMRTNEPRNPSQCFWSILVSGQSLSVPILSLTFSTKGQVRAHNKQPVANLESRLIFGMTEDQEYLHVCV